ncbi:unnamed protein product, partial [Symbiodinium sp. KB8]
MNYPSLPPQSARDEDGGYGSAVPPASMDFAAPAALNNPSMADEAALEHVSQARWCGPLDEIKKDYGYGIFMYFRFMQLLLVFNIVLSIPSLVLFAASATDLNPEYDGISRSFLGAYPSDRRWLWYLTSCLVFVGFIAFIFTYRAYHKKHTSNWRGEERTEEIDATLDIIEENDKLTHSARKRRRIISFIIFCLIVVAQGVVVYFLHLGLANQSDQILATVVAFTVTFLNIVWKKVSRVMTLFEKHRRMTRAKEWDVGKVFYLKITNVLM